MKYILLMLLFMSCKGVDKIDGKYRFDSKKQYAKWIRQFHNYDVPMRMFDSFYIKKDLFIWFGYAGGSCTTVTIADSSQSEFVIDTAR